MRIAILVSSIIIFVIPFFGNAKNLTRASTRTVEIEGIQFKPLEISVRSGDDVEWVNNDLVPHTVTSLEDQFDSKTIAPGSKWVLHTKKVGEFKYKCAYHPSMSGIVKVTK